MIVFRVSGFGFPIILFIIYFYKFVIDIVIIS